MIKYFEAAKCNTLKKWGKVVLWCRVSVLLVCQPCKLVQGYIYKLVLMAVFGFSQGK